VQRQVNGVNDVMSFCCFDCCCLQSLWSTHQYCRPTLCEAPRDAFISLILSHLTSFHLNREHCERPSSSSPWLRPIRSTVLSDWSQPQRTGSLHNAHSQDEMRSDVKCNMNAPLLLVCYLHFKPLSHWKVSFESHLRNSEVMRALGAWPRN